MKLEAIQEKQVIADALRFTLQKERSERKRKSLEANLKEVLGQLKRLMRRKKG